MWSVIWRALKIIRVLFPIVTSVYGAVQKKHPNKVSNKVAAHADTVIIDLAKQAGLNIGHTEAALVRSAVHYVRAKGERYDQLGK